MWPIHPITSHVFAPPISICYFTAVCLWAVYLTDLWDNSQRIKINTPFGSDMCTSVVRWQLQYPPCPPAFADDSTGVTVLRLPPSSLVPTLRTSRESWAKSPARKPDDWLSHHTSVNVFHRKTHNKNKTKTAVGWEFWWWTPSSVPTWWNPVATAATSREHWSKQSVVSSFTEQRSICVFMFFFFFSTWSMDNWVFS